MRSSLAVLGILLPLVWGSACGSDSGAGPGGQAGSGGLGGSGGSKGDAGPDAPQGKTLAVIELYPLDIWAQLLPESERQLTVQLDGAPAYTTGSSVVSIPLVKSGKVSIDLAAPEHRSVSISVAYDGTNGLSSAVLTPGSGVEGSGISFSHEMGSVDGASVPVHTVYLGLRHLWFSAEGRPARRGNQIELMMDGEQAWSSVAQDLKAASKSVVAATWWWQSDFELLRDPTASLTQSTSERWKNTILGILEASPAEKRVLVGQFWGQDSLLSFLTTDSKLKAHADATGDNFEFMGMGNPTEGKFQFEAKSVDFGGRVLASQPAAGTQQFDAESPIPSSIPSFPVDLTQWPVGVQLEHASYHQKFMVIDHEVAYIGGMNLKEVDWDTSKHLVFEPRRMLFSATSADRQAVKNKTKLPDNGPRKDYIVRIEGPAAQDAADVFHERWQHQLDTGVEYANKSTPFNVERNIAERPGGKQVQVTPTLPQPFWEHAIAETWLNAVAQANDFIYIEDQYFRAPLLNDAILARMKQVPGLRLVVITKPVSEWTDPGCPWTYKSHALFKTQFPTRYMLLQLRAFDFVVTFGIDETESRYADMDVHAKMLIVDDKFISVGSCNKNNRGMLYEGEMNIAILDPAWVREARRKILANLLPAGSAPSDDVSAWWDQLAQAAAWNDGVYAAWDAEGGDINLNGAPLPAKYTPKGFVHGMDFPDVSKCLIESVGPDMTLW